MLADSNKPLRNPKFQVRAVPYKNWSYVGCTDLGIPTLTHSALKELLSRVSEALDFVQAHSHLDVPFKRSHWITETVRGVCNRQLNGQCSVEDLDGKSRGDGCHMWLDTNDSRSHRTVFHHDPWKAESKCEEPASSILAKKELDLVETTISKTDYSKGFSASEQYEQLVKTVKGAITCLRKQDKVSPLDYTWEQMKQYEMVASVWPVIKSFYPDLVTEKEWKQLDDLATRVTAW